jgi:purine-binding chemotaxis protein CheW
MDAAAQVTVLVFTVSDISCALPAEHVVETMRMLPIVPVDNMPAFTRGVALIRGASVPVIDLALLLGRPAAAPSRLITVQAGGRTAALAVDDVRGLSRLDRERFEERPSVLSEGATPFVRALAATDQALHLVLDAARLAAYHDGPLV